MKKRIVVLLFTVLYFSAVGLLYAISLSSDYERIGYVDINKVFAKFPEVQKAKEKIKSDIDLKKEEIKKRKEEIKNLKSSDTQKDEKSEFEVKKETTAFAVSGGTDTANQVQDKNLLIEKKEKESNKFIEDIKEETAAFTVSGGTDTTNQVQDKNLLIEKKEKELNKFIEDVKKEIMVLDERYTQEVLGKIYEAIKKTGKEEGISIILDKKDVLYGKEVLDLTDKVIEELKRKK